MSKLTIDASFGGRLAAPGGHVELCDPSGKTVGHFLPPEAYEDYLDRLLSEGTPYSPSEMRIIRKQEGGRPLADIWKDLGR